MNGGATRTAKGTGIGTGTGTVDEGTVAAVVAAISAMNKNRGPPSMHYPEVPFVWRGVNANRAATAEARGVIEPGKEILLFVSFCHLHLNTEY